MSVQAGEAYIPVRADMSGFGKDVETRMRDANGRFVKAGEAVGTSFGTGLKGKAKGFLSDMKNDWRKEMTGVVAGVFAVQAVTSFFSASLAGARESAAVARQTAQVIKTTGAAAGVSADQVGDLAAALSKKTAVDDELIQSGANLLLTFKGIRNEAGKGNDIFNQTVALANDMSVAMGQDMKSSSLQLGKALNDPIKGVSALGKVGVQFTKDQREQIKALVDSGRTLDAQKIILAELEDQFGGSAAAQADAGKKMQVAWGNFQETVGALVIPMIDKLLGVLTPLAQWASEHPGIIMGVAAVIGGALVVAFTAWAISAGQAAVATIAATLPIIAIGAGVAALAAGLVYAYNKFGPFKAIVDTVAMGVAGLVRWIGDLVSAVARAAGTMWEPLARTFKGVVNAIISAWNRLDFSIDIRVPGWVPGIGGKGFQVDDVFPDVPKLHTGGVYKAPPGEREGLALLLDGERVLAPGESAGGVNLNFYDSGHDPGGVLNAFSWAMAGR